MESYLTWLESHASALALWMVVLALICGVAAAYFVYVKPVMWACKLLIAGAVVAILVLVAGPVVYTIWDKVIRAVSNRGDYDGSLPADLQTAGPLSSKVLIAGNYWLTAAVMVVGGILLVLAATRINAEKHSRPRRYCNIAGAFLCILGFLTVLLQPAA